LVNKFNRPAVMVALNNGHARAPADPSPVPTSPAPSTPAAIISKPAAATKWPPASASIRRSSKFPRRLLRPRQKNVTDEMLEEEIKLDCLAALSDLNEPVVTANAAPRPLRHRTQTHPLLPGRPGAPASPAASGKAGNQSSSRSNKTTPSSGCIAFNHGDWCDQLQSA